MAIIFSDSARDDYLDILDFLENTAKNPAFADSVDNEIRRVLKLAELPGVGAVPIPLQDICITIYRQVFAFDYRIINEPKGVDIHVHLLMHTARNFQSLLFKRFCIK